MTSHTNSLQCIFIWHSPDTYIFFPMSFVVDVPLKKHRARNKGLQWTWFCWSHSKLGQSHLKSHLSQFKTLHGFTLGAFFPSSELPLFLLRQVPPWMVLIGRVLSVENETPWRFSRRTCRTLDLERLLELCHKLVYFHSLWGEGSVCGRDYEDCQVAPVADLWVWPQSSLPWGGSYNTSEYNHLTKNHRFQSAATSHNRRIFASSAAHLPSNVPCLTCCILSAIKQNVLAPH